VVNTVRTWNRQTVTTLQSNTKYVKLVSMQLVGNSY